MHLKVFLKLKNPKKSLFWANICIKKIQETQKKTTGLVFIKPGFFPTLPGAAQPAARRPPAPGAPGLPRPTAAAAAGTQWHLTKRPSCLKQIQSIVWQQVIIKERKEGDFLCAISKKLYFFY
jgi:hypothetical protein